MLPGMKNAQRQTSKNSGVDGLPELWDVISMTSAISPGVVPAQRSYRLPSHPCWRLASAPAPWSRNQPAAKVPAWDRRRVAGNRSARRKLTPRGSVESTRNAFACWWPENGGQGDRGFWLSKRQLGRHLVDGDVGPARSLEKG